MMIIMTVIILVLVIKDNKSNNILIIKVTYTHSYLVIYVPQQASLKPLSISHYLSIHISIILSK